MQEKIKKNESKIRKICPLRGMDTNNNKLAKRDRIKKNFRMPPSLNLPANLSAKYVATRTPVALMAKE